MFVGLTVSFQLHARLNSKQRLNDINDKASGFVFTIASRLVVAVTLQRPRWDSWRETITTIGLANLAIAKCRF